MSIGRQQCLRFDCASASSGDECLCETFQVYLHPVHFVLGPSQAPPCRWLVHQSQQQWLLKRLFAERYWEVTSAALDCEAIPTMVACEAMQSAIEAAAMYFWRYLYIGSDVWRYLCSSGGTRAIHPCEATLATAFFRKFCTCHRQRWLVLVLRLLQQRLLG